MKPAVESEQHFSFLEKICHWFLHLVFQFMNKVFGCFLQTILGFQVTKRETMFLDLSDVWPVVGDRTYSLALQIKHHGLDRIWPNLPPPAHPHVEITQRGNQFRLCIQLLKQFMRFDKNICCGRVLEALNEVLKFFTYEVCNYLAFEILARRRPASTTQAGELGESRVC